jgi:hypothetical protein
VSVAVGDLHAPATNEEAFGLGRDSMRRREDAARESGTFVVYVLGAAGLGGACLLALACEVLKSVPQACDLR